MKKKHVTWLQLHFRMQSRVSEGVTDYVTQLVTIITCNYTRKGSTQLHAQLPGAFSVKRIL